MYKLQDPGININLIKQLLKLKFEKKTNYRYGNKNIIFIIKSEFVFLDFINT